MDEIDILLREARASLGPLCFGACSAKCCKQGKLLLDRHQMGLFTGGNEVVTRRDGYFELSLEPKGCANLTSDNKCSIFTEKLRPKMCDEYPFFRRNKVVFVASSCTGFMQGKLAIYLAKISELGYQVVVQ